MLAAGKIMVKKQKHWPWPHGGYLNNGQELFTKIVMEFKTLYKCSKEGFPVDSQDLKGKREESIPVRGNVQDRLMEENLENLGIKRNLLWSRANH